jgi:hypothetical protein
MSQKQILIENISETNDVKKLEMTISMLMFGWVMDDHNTKEYEELIEVSVNRLNILMLIRGEEHPLQNVDLVRDRERIEMSVKLSMIKSVMDMEKMNPLHQMSMN